MNVLLLALQASLCLIAQAGLAIPNFEVPVHKPIPIDIVNQLPKVVGGQNALPNEFPFMVQMLIKWPTATGIDQTLCGASIINSDYVLTAGHCVNIIKYGGMALPQNIELYFGMTRDGDYTQMIKGLMIITKGYKADDPNHVNDIAIIQLTQKIQMSPAVQPICLASGTSDYADRTATAMGWGITAYGYGRPGVQQEFPDYLQKIQFPVLSPSKCTQLSGHSSDGHPGKICVYDDQNAERGICGGDSGSPLVVSENGRYVQIGIDSYIYGSCGDNRPIVYSRVSYFIDFIQGVVGTYSTC